MGKSNNILPRDALLDLLRALLVDEPDVIAVYLFGSAAQEKAHRQSDIDIAVLFDPTLNNERIYKRCLAIGSMLEAHLSPALDVVPINTAPLLLQFKILQTGILALEHDRTQRALFHMRTANRYYDAKPYLMYHQQETMRRIQQKGLGRGYDGHRDALAEARRLRAALASASAGDPR